MRTTLPTILLMISVTLARSSAQGRVSRGVLDAARVLPVASFSESPLKAIAREFLSTTAREYSIARLTLVSDRNDLTRIMGTLQLHGPGYCAVAAAAAPHGYVARVIAINGNAILSLREPRDLASPAKEWRLSQGGDPIMMTVEGSLYRLLHFSRGPNAASPSEVVFYFQAQETPSVRECEKLLAQMRDLAAAGRVEIHVRTDFWFVDSTDFPVFFPFYNDWGSHRTNWPRIPSALEYFRSPEVSCLIDNKNRPHCFSVFEARP